MAQPSIERFERTILPHLDDAYTLARYLTRDEHDAQDAVQDAALRAFRHFDGFRGDEPRAWFLAIVRNCCRTRLHRQKRDRHVVAYDDESAQAANVATNHDADEALAAADTRAMVRRAVAELPDDFREAIVLREVQELSYKEMSEIMAVPIGTVMSRLARARKRLAALVGDHVREAS
jgi:RNA polymerase sigma-70 factor (ECF subfamily)